MEAHHHHHHNHIHDCSNLKNLKLVLILTAVYMIAEFIGGYFTNSLALMADAGHMLGDVISLAMAFGAIYLATKKTSVTKTFGYYRAEILAAFLNGLTLVLISAMIFYEAYHRLINIREVQGLTMLLIAFGGLVINIIGAKLLHSGAKENLNVKGAFLHILADLLGSIGAILAGCLIYFFNIYIADPIISFVIAGLILTSSIGIIKSTIDILMEGVPSNIDIKEVQEHLEEIENVKEVHDLHIWCINSNTVSLSVHLTADMENAHQILCSAKKLLKEHFDISHSTIQIEPINFEEDKCIFDINHKNEE